MGEEICRKHSVASKKRYLGREKRTLLKRKGIKRRATATRRGPAAMNEEGPYRTKNVKTLYKNTDGTCAVVNRAVCDSEDCTKCLFALSRVMMESVGFPISRSIYACRVDAVQGVKER